MAFFSPGEAIAAILPDGIRLYPEPAPRDAASPYSVWTVASAGPELETFGGRGTGVRYVVQVDSYGKSAAEAEEEANKIRTAFCGPSSVWRSHRYGNGKSVRIGYDTWRDGTPAREAGSKQVIHNRSTDFIFVPGR